MKNFDELQKSCEITNITTWASKENMGAEGYSAPVFTSSDVWPLVYSPTTLGYALQQARVEALIKSSRQAFESIKQRISHETGVPINTPSILEGEYRAVFTGPEPKETTYKFWYGIGIYDGEERVCILISLAGEGAEKVFCEECKGRLASLGLPPLWSKYPERMLRILGHRWGHKEEGAEKADLKEFTMKKVDEIPPDGEAGHPIETILMLVDKEGSQEDEEGRKCQPEGTQTPVAEDTHL